MTGGLLQLAAIGRKDIFLTYKPQITFFKAVFKRYANFAMEYVEEAFNGTQNFGENLTCTLSKAGDLLFRLYLKITLPQVALAKSSFTEADPNSDYYPTLLNYYNTIQYFVNTINYNLVNPLYDLINIPNLKIFDLDNKYNNIKNHANYADELAKLNNIIITFNKSFRLPLQNLDMTEAPLNPSIVYYNTNTNMQSILDFNTYYQFVFHPVSGLDDDIILNDKLQTLLDTYLAHLKIIKQNLFDLLLFYKNKSLIINRENINFAWVDFIGHQLIKSVEITIGNKQIDMTDAVRMNIHYQLTNKILQNQTYQELVGNIETLTNYNSIAKPEYTMFIPLDFWCNKYSGIALPLVAIRFHDVNINLKLNDLTNCCYFEKLKSSIVIENFIKLKSVSLICNYIYIGSDERIKFANGHHEYLIDQQLQNIEYNNISQPEFIAELGLFNPGKQLFWFCRTNDNLTRLKYFEFSTSYYTDIYSFENVISDPHTITTNTSLVKFNTVDQYMNQHISIGDTIEIHNSIYYSGTYKVIDIYNGYIYIEYPTYMQESYSYNYDIFLLTYTKSDNFIANSQAYVKKVNNFNPITTSGLTINGVNRFNNRSRWSYYNYVQPYQSNSQTPSTGINTYSFALNPEDYQPSGFLNFNRIEISKLTMTLNSKFVEHNLVNLYVYLSNYNILKVEHGKAGIVLNI